MGDALSATARIADADTERVRERAKLIFESMRRLGYAGYVVGERDLVLGRDRLKELSSATGVPLLSANLVDEGGKPLFSGHVVVHSGNLTVCAVAVTGKLDGIEGVTQTDAGQAALKELADLQSSRCDVKLLLAHMPLAEVEEVLKAAPGFDLAVEAHQGFQMDAKRIGDTSVLFAGERGRQVLRLRLESSGAKTPFVDEGAVDRLHEDLASLDKTLEDLKKRKKAASADQAKGFDKTIDTFQTRRAELQQRIASQKNPHAARVFKAELVNLGTDVSDEAETLAAVNAYLAVYPDVHPAPPPHPPPPPPAVPAPK
jgi:2',3'-cyclic-nucleotide 2'-phosphodiesterase (5'-nucleotidase family)